MVKKIICAFIFVVSSMLMAEPSTSVRKPSPIPGVSDEEWARLTPKERMMRAVGGMIPNKTTGIGSIAIINAQNRISADTVRKHAEKMESLMWMRVNYFNSEKTVSIDNLDLVLEDAKGNVSVVIGSFEGLPRVMVIPEKRAAVVNAFVLSDGVDANRAQERLCKEISRAIAFVFGVFTSERPGILDETATLGDLDKMMVDVFTQEVVFLIERPAMKFGITRFSRITYKHACERGIAPPPKNKWQQRIFDNARIQRKNESVNGLKIEFDSKKGK